MKSSDSIKVSVVVAVYNGASTLPRCLDSVIGQTYPNIEVICVNDCSPDDSHLVLERYAQEYPQIRVINHTENKHGGGADNTGIKAAQGNYVCILDQDDWLELDAIEVLVNNSDSGSKDIVLGQWQQVSADGVVVKQNNMIVGGTLDENIRHAFMYGCRILGGLFKKSLFVDNNLWYPEKVNWADNGLYNAIIMVAKSICVVDKTIYNYYTGVADSSSKTYSIKSVLDRIKTTDLCLERCLNLDYSKKYTRNIYFRYLYLTAGTIYILSTIQDRRVISIAQDLDLTIRNLKVADVICGMDEFDRDLILSPVTYVRRAYLKAFKNKVKMYLFCYPRNVLRKFKNLLCKQ